MIRDALANGMTGRLRTGLCTLVALALLIAPLEGADTMEMLAAGGEPGAIDVPVTIAFTNDSDMEGYSVALSYDVALITCTGVSEVGGFLPEFFESIIDEVEGTVVIGAILALEPESSQTIPASADEAVEMVELTFDVDLDARPGEVASLELANGIGSPPISNVYSVGGQDVSVELVSSPFVVENPNEYRFEDKSPIPGRFFVVGVLCTHPENLDGYSVEVSYDTDDMLLRDIFTEPTEDLLGEEVPDSSDIEFLDIDIDNVAGVSSIATIFDSSPPFEDAKALVAGDDQKIIELEFLPDSGFVDDDTMTVEFTQGKVGNLVTYRGGELAVEPITTDGEFTFEAPPELEFVRGDANGNGGTNLADGIFILSWRFIEGREPRCLDAADFNDDGRTDIADAISLFTWQFLEGTAPADPFPDCGFDSAEVDDLGCLETSSDCE